MRPTATGVQRTYDGCLRREGHASRDERDGDEQENAEAGEHLTACRGFPLGGCPEEHPYLLGRKPAHLEAAAGKGEESAADDKEYAESPAEAAVIRQSPSGRAQRRDEHSERV